MTPRPSWQDVGVEPAGSPRTWTFLTNHGHVLIYLARNPDARVRDIADAVGITERATMAILGDLVDGGYVTRSRVGRRNTYEVRSDAALRHPEESDHQVGEILEIFLDE